MSLKVEDAVRWLSEEIDISIYTPVRCLTSKEEGRPQDDRRGPDSEATHE